ncbi:MAG TPA: hypothetical protein VE178_08820 [Silvibacterium sp.]|nr:hypothetical protein [Silvibacterium sp.]
MKTSWQTETGRLACRWSGAWERRDYNPPWIQQGSGDTNVSPLTPDFTMVSSFGSGEWFAPWNVRWSVPERR